MKRTLFLIMIPVLLLCAGIPAAVFGDTQKKAKEITVVFTHDMHSHLEKFPKLATVIREEKKKNGATFVVDGGDFSMGTPYQTIWKRRASELRMMGFAGFDAATLGNHEFDYRSEGLRTMLKNAKRSGDPLPQLVIANIDWKGTLKDKKLKADGEKLRESMKAFGVKDYTVLERGGAKIAVFGIFGKESASYAPESGTKFLDPVKSAKRTVTEINREVPDADLIVCISHSGINPENLEKSEDIRLAEETEGIDLIVSGHSHTYMKTPIRRNGVVIASCGQYNDNAGVVRFRETAGKGFVYKNYLEEPLDKKVKNDKATQRKTAAFKKLVNREYFADFGYSWDQVLARSDIRFTPIDSFGQKQGEDTLGNLISDGYIYGVRQAEGSGYEHVDAAVVPAGVVRGSFRRGDITVADAFNALSLGTGKDGKPGYPLVSVYLTARELRLAAEVDISISPLMQPARLYFSGLNYKYNPHRFILDRSYDVMLKDSVGDGKTRKPEKGKLYRVVADLYSAQMLSTVNSMSRGLLSLEPKDENGKVITDFEDRIIRGKDGSELKEWYALASYIDSFSGNKVPARYAAAEGRKICENSWSPASMNKDHSAFFWILVGLLSLVVLIVALIIRGVRRMLTQRH